MALPSYMLGLLDNGESLAPNLGLLGGGVDPVKAMMGSLALQQPKMAPAAPTLPPGVRATGPAPYAAPPPPPPPPSLARGPGGVLANPTQTGFLAGGIAALEANPGSAYTGPGPVIAAALKAGIPAYIATKQGQADRDLAAEQDKSYAALLNDPSFTAKLRPEQIRLLRGMSARQGLKLAEDLAKQEKKVIERDPAKDVIDMDGNIVQKGSPVPKPEDPLLPERDLATAAELEGLDPNKRREWTPEQRARVAARLQTLNRAKGTNVSIDARGPEKGLDAAVGAGLRDERTAVAGVVEARPAIQQALKLLDAGIKTGTFANARTTIANALNTIGASNDETVANTQAYIANVANLVIPIAKSFGSGSGFSDKDREFLYQAKAGNISDDPRALKAILLTLDKAARLARQHYQRRADDVTRNADEATRAFYRIDDPLEGADSATPGGQSRAALRKWYEDNKQPVPDWLK